MASFGTGFLGGIVLGGAAAVGVAAFNPILPVQDHTPAPAAVEQGAAPATGTNEDVSTAASGQDSSVARSTAAGAEVVAPASDATPQIDSAALRPNPVAVEVDTQAGAATDAPGGPSLQVPTGSDAAPASQDSLALQSPSAESQPSVSTTTADPVRLAEPDLETAAPRQQTASAAPELGALNVPQSQSPTIAGASAPSLPRSPEVTASDEGAGPAINRESAAAPSGLGQPNVGTFDTSGAALSDGQSSSFVTTSPSPDTPRQPTVGSLAPQSPNLGDGAPGPSGALLENATSFQDTGKPLLSIVLIDTGDDRMGHDKLVKLGFPATIAVPADAQGAKTAGLAFRQAGFDVLALPPSDVAISLSGNQSRDQVQNAVATIFDLLPSAVGLIDLPSADLQRDRVLSSHVVAALAQGGHAIVSYDTGLNPIPQAAEKEGVFDGVVMRVLDANEEGGLIIGRSLDRAVAVAQAQGQAIVVGTTRPQTVLSIVNWALSARANAVDLAPVSASLIRARR